MRGRVKSSVFEQLCDENKSGGLGKSSKKLSESSMDAEKESKEKFGSCSKCSGSEEGKTQVSVWSWASGTAGTWELTDAMRLGPGCRL